MGRRRVDQANLYLSKIGFGQMRSGDAGRVQAAVRYSLSKPRTTLCRWIGASGATVRGQSSSLGARCSRN